MPRFPFIAVYLILIGSVASAQDEPPLIANADSSAMIEQYRQELDGLKTPEAQAAAFSQLLSFQLRFADKAPAAETVKALTVLAESLEKGPLRNQLLEAIAFAQSELGDYGAVTKTLDLIEKPQERAENQLNLAEKFLAENEKKQSETPFNVVALLRSAVDGAVAAKDPGLEALALATLGGELLKSGNTGDAKAAFQQSREKAKELEELEERNILGLIVRNKVHGGLTAEAVALAASVTNDDVKAALTGVIARTEAMEGRLDAARKTIDSMKPGDARDGALVEVGRLAAKTEPAAALLELSKEMISPERSDVFQGTIIRTLAEEKRLDIAEEFANGAEKPDDCRLALSFHRLDLLIDDKKFDDAEKLVEAFADPRLKIGAVGHLAMACIEAGKVDRAERLLESFRSVEEAAALKELAAAATKAAAETNLEIRTETQFEILRAQLRLLDLKGAKQTLDSMVGTVQKVENLARRVQYSLVLASVLSQFDKARSKTILADLFTFLVDLKDPMLLKELVSEEPSDSMQPVLVLPVAESAVKEQLFFLYVNIANLLSQSGNGETAKKALGQAGELLGAEPDVAVKLERLLLLAQLYAEAQ